MLGLDQEVFLIYARGDVNGTLGNMGHPAQVKSTFVN